MEKLSPIQEETVRRRGSRADYPFGEAGGRKTKMPALVCLKTAWRTGAENIKRVPRVSGDEPKSVESPGFFCSSSPRKRG